MHMFCIVLADCPHGSCKRTFLKPGLGVENAGNAVLAFSCGQRIHILCVTMTPSPHPSTCNLRPLNPAPSHNNNNNNNGGLYACVCAAEDVEPIRVTRAKYYAPLPLCWAKKDYGQPTSHFCLLLWWSISPSTVSLCSISSSPFLVNFKHHL